MELEDGKIEVDLKTATKSIVRIGSFFFQFEGEDGFGTWKRKDDGDNDTLDGTTVETFLTNAARIPA